MHQLCRADCFSTAYFPKCLQALLLEEAQSVPRSALHCTVLWPRYMEMVRIIGK